MNLNRLILVILLALPLLALLGIRNTQAQYSWLGLADYALHARITLHTIEEDASGLAFDPVRQRLWLVSNDALLFELSPEGEILRQIDLKGFNDPEGLAWLETRNGNTRLALSEERRGNVLLLDIPPMGDRLNHADAQVLARFGKQPENHGLEGLAIDPHSRQLFAINEYYPKATFRISGSHARELWRVGWSDFWHEPWDYAGLAFVPATGNLLVVSDRSQDLREYSLEGEELAKMELNVRHPEGIAIAPDGTLYICAEPNILLIYKPTGLPGKIETADLGPGD